MFTEIEILAIPIWYWLLAVANVSIGLIGAWIHRNSKMASPGLSALFGLVVGSMIIVFSGYLAPAFTGYWIHGWNLLGIISGVFLVLWLVLDFQAMYNIVRYGRVVA